MPNRMQDNPLPNHDDAQPLKPWFIAVLIGIVAAGALLMYLASRYYGPGHEAPQTDPMAQAEIEAQEVAALLTQAAQARRQGRFQEAMGLLDQLLQEHPEITAAHVAAGEVAMQLRNFDRAQKEFQIVAQEAPEDAEAAAYLTAIAVLRKDYPAARSLLEKAMANPALQRNGQYAYGTLVLKAACYADQPETAMETLRQALKAAGRNDKVIHTAAIYGSQVVLYTAQVLEEQANPADAAIAYALAAEKVRTASASTPPPDESPSAWSARAAELYLQAGMPRQAAGQIASALQAEPQNAAYKSLQDQVTTALATQPAGSQPDRTNPQ